LNRTFVALTAALALVGCKKNEPVLAAPIAPPAAGVPGMPPPPGMPPGAVPPAMQNPKDVQAWISLGNDYFDSHQTQPAIDAYANALALDPKNPDVLTDQGVMYREQGQYDKAVANFLKANQIAPAHMQSLFNAGVVYAYDLKDYKRAEETWLKVIANDKSGRFAAQAGNAIAEIRQRGAAPGAPAPLAPPAK
jgi:tetratricopeptide (TPR) repeat protein